jgi:hypothetical protein
VHHARISAAEGTVRFGLGGTEYEIDLNTEHARQPRTPGFLVQLQRLWP